MNGPSAPTSEQVGTDATPVLELQGLHKVYPGRPEIRAVDGIDLQVTEGELFGLLGPNGAGKSTTVGICTTRIRPTRGRVRVTGLDVVADSSAVKRRIGVVTQANTLDRSLTLRENLRFHCRYFGWSSRDARRRADELLERFRLGDRADAFPDEISGGMAQRLQVARAIAHGPRVLFLDEPTAGLDPQSRIALWALVAALRGDGLTVVLTTHYMQEAEELCDRVAIVDHGRLLVCDTPARLKEVHGSGTVIDLAIDVIDEAVLAKVAALEGITTVEPREGGLRVHATAPDRVLGAVVSALGDAGLRDLTVHDSTLEAVFIHLTGRDLRE